MTSGQLLKVSVIWLSLEPSLGSVAVLLFYSNRYGISEDMYREYNRHLLTPFSGGVADRLAPCLLLT